MMRLIRFIGAVVNLAFGAIAFLIATGIVWCSVATAIGAAVYIIMCIAGAV